MSEDRRGAGLWLCPAGTKSLKVELMKGERNHWMQREEGKSKEKVEN